jgi:hypothetical protein
MGGSAGGLEQLAASLEVLLRSTIPVRWCYPYLTTGCIAYPSVFLDDDNILQTKFLTQ